MNTFNLPTVTHLIVDIEHLTEEKLEKILIEFKQEYSNYDIDGLVLTLDESKRENVAYPENKIAFKVNQEAIKTTVINVEWNTSRTGRVVPIVCIDPVNIDGVTISKATGFNAKFIKDNKIMSGKEIGILRSGDVIPYLVIL